MIGNIRRKQAVYIVDGSRTPFLKAKGMPGPFSAADLAVQTARQLLLRQPFTASDVDEVITGCVMPSPDEVNISRIIALRLGCGDQTPAWTVQRNCASGLQAIDSAAQDILSGRHHLILAGGTDAMSHAPLLYNKLMVSWLAQWYRAKSLPHRLALLSKIRFSFLTPVIALLKGLRDPLIGLNMGQTAENLAYEFAITRAQMDAFALQSHQRLTDAKQHFLQEITPIYDHQGTVYTSDDGVRADSTLEKLATLSPFFDKKYGQVTAGNSSQVTDGAAYLLLASQTAVEQYRLPTLAKITAIEWAGMDPSKMGLGPVHAIVPMLNRLNLQLADIDYWEINEAFAAQVIGCCRAMASDDYCREHFHLPKAFGNIDPACLNIDGGAIAAGHPVGASGARVALHLANVLKRQKARRGVAALCIGGGQGGAILVENTAEE